MRRLALAIAFPIFSTALPARASTAVIVDLPCVNEIVMQVPGGGPDGSAYNYDQPVGAVVHTAQRNRPTEGAPLTAAAMAHQRVTTKTATYEGLENVVRNEFFVDGFPVSEIFVKNEGPLTYLWQPKERRWQRRPIVAFPDAAHGRHFRVLTRTEAGRWESDLHYRWEFLKSFRCPADGQTYEDIYALVLYRYDGFDGGGKPVGDTGMRSVAYYRKNYGPLYGYQAKGDLGHIPAPAEAKIASDWFRTIDDHWPLR